MEGAKIGTMDAGLAVQIMYSDELKGADAVKLKEETVGTGTGTAGIGVCAAFFAAWFASNLLIYLKSEIIHAIRSSTIKTCNR